MARPLYRSFGTRTSLWIKRATTPRAKASAIGDRRLTRRRSDTDTGR